MSVVGQPACCRAARITYVLLFWPALHQRDGDPSGSRHSGGAGRVQHS